MISKGWVRTMAHPRIGVGGDYLMAWVQLTPPAGS